MKESVKTGLRDRLAKLRANHRSLPVSYRRCVLEFAINEMQSQLEAEELPAAMRLIPPRDASARNPYPQPLRRQA